MNEKKQTETETKIKSADKQIGAKASYHTGSRHAAWSTVSLAMRLP